MWYDELPTERLEHEVVSSAGRVAAELCRFLLMIAELDRRQAWATWDCRSCAYWLSWRCGLSRSTAHEQLRVGHALHRLPATVEAFSAGELSYSKVRAITRIATPETEGQLVELARTATAAQLDLIVKASIAAARDPEEVAAERRLGFGEDDGLGTVHARLLPEQQVSVETAIAAAVEELPVEESSAEDIGRRRADALHLICETYLADHRPRQRPACERQQVVLHEDADVVAGRKAAQVEGTGLHLHPKTARRLGCDASVLVMFERDGKTIGAGHSTQTIPRKARRALHRRSRGRCEWPGCDSRVFLDGHHIWHWEDGGPTELDNLAHLCWAHHHAVHEGGCRVVLTDSGLRAFRRDGTEVEAVPTVRATPGPDLHVVPDGTVARWGGERLDLACAVDAVLGLRTRAPAAAW